MKKLLFILLCLPIIGFGQIANGKIKDLTTESIFEYFKNNKTEPVEGIYKDNDYTILVVKQDDIFIGYILEIHRFPDYYEEQPGLRKFELTPTKNPNSFSMFYHRANGGKKRNLKMNFVDGLTLQYRYFGFNVFKRIGPNLNSKKDKKNKNGNWAGNGSGIIVSKSGHIITNNHVITGADDIEVEFILDSEVQKFNAEIVQVDKTNDLAILKIVDVNFDEVDNLPYNFKTRSSDVGTKVYAYGYPMALSIMGKEIKVTDGIISSKTGFEGNITTYQITAPIQGGNSGGPLFDEKANLIGINSSGIRKDIADNVGYSIKTSYVLNLIDILPKSIDLPSSNKLANLPLTEQIKQLTKYVVLVKVK